MYLAWEEGRNEVAKFVLHIAKEVAKFNANISLEQPPTIPRSAAHAFMQHMKNAAQVCRRMAFKAVEAIVVQSTFLQKMIDLNVKTRKG
jgi:phenylalanyl-tRNA synthetase alpha subunit